MSIPRELPPAGVQRRWLRRTLLALAGLILVAAVAAGGFLSSFGPVAAGYTATMGAVQMYGTGDALETVVEERVRLPFGLGGFLELEVVDPDEPRVRARAFGLFEAEATWRAGLGATRILEGGRELPAAIPDLVPPLSTDEPWPAGDSLQLAPLEPGLRDRVEAAFERAFVDGEGRSRGTHAACLVVGGRLVHERYREGYDHLTPILGWSMTKSVTGTLIARLIELGRLEGVGMRAPVPEWQGEGDPRAAITLEDLLRMQSGLEFFANYELPWADSLQMLFIEADFGAFAARKPLVHEPGSVWSYSDGTSNILARIVRRHAGETLEEQLRFPQEELFAPLGMSTATLGVDPSGTWVGSSFMLASARDWARYGQLHLDDGVVDGRRLLPEGWVEFAASVTAESDGKSYGGAQLWRFDEEELLDVRGQPVPAELGGVIYASGHDGQYVWIDRARGLVLVRLGILEAGFDPVGFVSEIVSLFPER